MPQIDSLKQEFIGIVKGQDPLHRTVDVFIPKLMPTIPEDRIDVETPTNFGMNNIDISYSNNILQTSTITARAIDMDKPMPDVGSRVRIKFLEGIPGECFWDKWNPNGDYSVIESEKYPNGFSLTINDKTTKVDFQDEIIIKFPFAENIFYEVDENNPKRKIFSVVMSEKTDQDLTTLFNIVGTIGGVVTTKGPSNQTVYNEIKPSGIIKDVMDLQATVNDLKAEIDALKAQLENK